MSFKTVATIGVPYATTALAFQKSRASKGEKVLVLGESGVVGYLQWKLCGVQAVLRFVQQGTIQVI